MERGTKEKAKMTRKTSGVRPTIDCAFPGKTEQAHAKDTDINYILKDYTRTGFIKHANRNQGRYDDVTGVDFQDAMNIIATANSMFENLPSQIRKRFNQNPAEFLDFVQNPANGTEMERMGILKGNDGLDISGTPNAAPTAESVQAARAAESPVTPAEPEPAQAPA